RHRMGPTLSQDLIRVVREGRRAEGRTGEVTEYGHEVFDREGSEAVDGVRPGAAEVGGGPVSAFSHFGGGRPGRDGGQSGGQHLGGQVPGAECALDDRAVEQALGGRGGQMRADALAAGGLAEDGDVLGIAAERADAVADPPQGRLLVEQTEDTGVVQVRVPEIDRKSTRLHSSHVKSSYA